MRCDHNKALLGALLASAIWTGPGQAQTAPATPQDQVTVTGQKMPAAEAPRSSTCETLARDPHYRAMLNTAGGLDVLPPTVYVPTRLTRNPDYNASPSVPVGSALPTLPKSRFAMRNTVDGGVIGTATGDGLADVTSSDGFAGSVAENDIGSAVAACRAAYSRGVGSTAGSFGSTGYISAASSLSENAFLTMSPEFRAGAANARYLQARSFIASHDTSLPMAFALYDQGRYGESLDWFRKASKKLQMREGGDEAALFVGKLYLQGLRDQSDPAEGVKWLKKVATAPFNPTNETPMFDPRQPDRNTAVGEAAVILANVYRSGFGGIAKDPAEARKWYARANAVGHIPAAKTLGDLYYRGIDTPRDVKKAVGYYRQAAKLNHPDAQFALAEILYAGEDGIAQDRSEALAWYQAAAKNNHGGALYALGRAYDLGEGVKADQTRAIGFYKTAALGGNPAAMVAMGTYFYRGEQVAKDQATARGWFESAAAAADADGMFNLAAMLAKGEGGGKDSVRAWGLLKRAAALGHVNAPRALAALEQRMTPAERQAVAASQQTR